MSLEAQPPARVIETIGDGGRRIRGAFVTVHRLQPKMREREAAQFFRPQALLRENELQLGPRVGNEGRARFWADAKPIETGRRGEGAIGFDRDFEAPGMYRADQRRVELQQRFATGENYKTVLFACGPSALDGYSKRFGVSQAAAASSDKTGKIRSAKAVNRERT